MRMRCMCVVIHGPNDLRVEEQDAGEIGPGQVRVDVAMGGICGSDLHYFRHGGFGAIRLQQPMVLGHEVAGTVAEVAPDVTSVKAGDRVAVNPSRPCGACRYCLEGLPNQCLDMRFYGSAMRMPHVQGAFRNALVCDAVQCVKVADHVPLSLAVASALGADRTINAAADAGWVERYGADKGTFDVMIECSGNARALRDGLDVMRPRGIVVQLGLGGDVSLPQNVVVAKELSICGSFRFHAEFALAVQLINAGRVDLRPAVTRVFPMRDANRAFELAGDRQRAMKVLIDFANDAA
ncbi:L-idonate 5-dehydrogenase [Burkholderia anthina]|uniref:L-idonate 5-dehydrogenase n=1 Tax=Burkholderia anthina TaxID=179879 RepID=UPI000F5D7D78|nr:L-idonate 5-dehydrogenase [Burkholderia anthina]RQX81907.1 L-idonate 5-dehydrogenase [Burkholderia anthina]